MKKLIQALINKLDSILNIKKIYDIMIFQNHMKNQKNSKNPFNSFGSKSFSQSDEDGLTLEIIKRIGIEKGTFLEFGVGDGTENNSLILLNLDWRGCWVGNEELKIDISKSSRLKYLKNWVTVDNISQISKVCLDFVKSKSVDFISMDLDGNDYYLTQKILENGIKPKLFIVEYNGKFIPPLRFIQKYDEKHHWNNNDYFGSALTSYNDLFESYNYKLICCNSWTGANAFFVKQEFLTLFPEVPVQIEELFNPPFYHIREIGHPVSEKTIEKILE